jgi:methionyl-tRNA formyltransferase
VIQIGGGERKTLENTIRRHWKMARFCKVAGGEYWPLPPLGNSPGLTFLPIFSTTTLGSGCGLKFLMIQCQQTEVYVRMRLVFMGTPQFAVPALKTLVRGNHEILAVYTQPDRPVGRGQILVSPPLKKAAEILKLSIVQSTSLKGEGEEAGLAALKPDIIVVAAYGKILPPPFLEIPRYGCLNIHPSLLPRHRGASPVAATILAGDQFGGVSIMLMDAGLDTGPVLAQAKVPVAAGDTTGRLTDKLSIVAAQLLGEVLISWTRSEVEPRPQNEAAASYSTTITKAEGEIDWQCSALGIWRMVRALQPWPGGYTHWLGKRLKIVEATPLLISKSARSGEVLAQPVAGKTEVAFGVATGSGVLGIHKIQLEGKRVMSSEEFLHGQRQLIGAILG